MSDVTKGQDSAAEVPSAGNRVIIRFDISGDISYLVEQGSGIDLYIVDERAPNDRVYRWSSVAPPTEIEVILGQVAIGHSGDVRHAAIAACVEEVLTGKPRLQVVSPVERSETAQ